MWSGSLFKMRWCWGNKSDLLNKCKLHQHLLPSASVHPNWVHRVISAAFLPPASALFCTRAATSFRNVTHKSLYNTGELASLQRNRAAAAPQRAAVSTTPCSQAGIASVVPRLHFSLQPHGLKNPMNLLTPKQSKSSAKLPVVWG